MRATEGGQRVLGGAFSVFEAAVLAVHSSNASCIPLMVAMPRHAKLAVHEQEPAHEHTSILVRCSFLFVPVCVIASLAPYRPYLNCTRPLPGQGPRESSSALPAV